MSLNCKCGKYMNELLDLLKKCVIPTCLLYGLSLCFRPKPVVLCGVAGCENPKRYSCSKTRIPLCSLECYRKNLTASDCPMVTDFPTAISATWFFTLIELWTFGTGAKFVWCRKICFEQAALWDVHPSRRCDPVTLVNRQCGNTTFYNGVIRSWQTKDLHCPWSFVHCCPLCYSKWSYDALIYIMYPVARTQLSKERDGNQWRFLF